MTTQTKHTQGPWKAEHSGFGDAKVRAHCGWKNKDGSSFIPTIVDRTSWENANLIAAAPELLEALKLAMKESDWFCDEDFKKMKAAIAKAEGQS